MRWLKDEVWDGADLILQEPFIGTSSKNLKQTDICYQTNFIPKHYDNIQEVQVHQHIQKKIEYGRLMGHFKRALNYSLENNDQNNLDSILLAYISEKEAKLIDKEQLERRNVLNENLNSGNEMKLSDGRIYDLNDIRDPINIRVKVDQLVNDLKLIMRNQVVRFIKKMYEEDLEKLNDNTNGRRCGLCHKTGHYAPKCPNKSH